MARIMPPNRNRKPPAQVWGEHAPWPQPEDLRQWLQDETQRLMKEAELRITDATEFVTDYLTGEISRKEAEKRYREYGKRWGDALQDVPNLEDGMTAQQIYAAQSKHRAEGNDPNWMSRTSADKGKKGEPSR